MKTSLLSLLVATVVLSASAQAKNNSSEAASQAQARQTQDYVDARMHETLSSIDRSLTTLVSITRGGEAARKSGPIGATVAGAAGAQRAADAPPALPVSPADESVLDRKVDIQWNGSADVLLSNVSSQIGFSFTNQGRPLNHQVRVEGKNLTVRELLSLVANQVNGQADIHVSLPDRRLSLVRR